MDLFQSPEDFQKQYPLLATGVVPAKKYNEDLPAEERKQRRNDNDQLLWDVLCSTKDGNNQANIRVRIPSETEPAIEPGLILFGGLANGTYGDGVRLVVTFRADTFTQSAPPSAKRSKAEAPAPVAQAS